MLNLAKMMDVSETKFMLTLAVELHRQLSYDFYMFMMVNIIIYVITSASSLSHVLQLSIVEINCLSTNVALATFVIIVSAAYTGA